MGFSIENMVYFELFRRGYQVAIGKNGAAEVDFVARKQGILTYYQVTADMTAEETFERRCVRSGPSGTTTKDRSDA